MKILKLTLCCVWFDMILRGEKPEEYRDIKQFWTRRFIRSNDIDSVCYPFYWDELVAALLKDTTNIERFDFYFKEFDAVEFYRGAPYYGKELPRITLQLQSITTGFGLPKFGAPEDRRVFILKLGSIIETHNCETLKTIRL